IGFSLTAQSGEPVANSLMGKWKVKNVLIRAQHKEYRNGHYENTRLLGHAINLSAEDCLVFRSDSTWDAKLGPMKFRLTAKNSRAKQSKIGKVPRIFCENPGTWKRKGELVILDNPEGRPLEFHIKILSAEKLVLALEDSGSALKTGKSRKVRMSFVFERE